MCCSQIKIKQMKRFWCDFYEKISFDKALKMLGSAQGRI